VVILGGGFGGIAAARGLADTSVQITVLDRRNHHVFQPLLYQVATAGLSPSDIAHPIRSILADQANVTVLLAEVNTIDTVANTVTIDDGTIDDGTVTAFDYLIVATGTTHSYFGNDSWEAHAPGLKTIEDAIEIRRRVLLAFERAERTNNVDERRANLTFVVIGGGPTGVETAGAIAEIAFQTLTREFRSIDPGSATVILLEGAPRVLGAYPESLSHKAERQLRDLGVDVRLGVTVTDLDDGSVSTTAGLIPTRTAIWAAGNTASPLGAMLGGPTDRAGRVLVDADLSVPGHPNVFAVGDIAHAVCGGHDVPGVAQGAIQGGAQAARAIRADLAGTPRPAFRYRDKGELATIGRSSAVGTISIGAGSIGTGRQLHLSGWIAWMAWWSIHILFLIDFRSRISVMLNWGWNYLTFQRGARLITGPWTPRTSRPDGEHVGT
jgi:NADH:ubiquinone reductase (H+-translocating)